MVNKSDDNFNTFSVTSIKKGFKNVNYQTVNVNYKPHKVL